MEVAPYKTVGAKRMDTTATGPPLVPSHSPASDLNYFRNNVSNLKIES